MEDRMTVPANKGSWSDINSTDPSKPGSVKGNLIDQLMKLIEADKGVVENASRESIEDARGYSGNDAESPSSARKLQAQTLAEGFSKSVVERSGSLEKLRQLKGTLCREARKCALGALVQLQNQTDGTSAWYFLVTEGGAVNKLKTEDGREILAISMQAPLASKMVTKEVGDKLSYTVKGVKKIYEILKIE